MPAKRTEPRKKKTEPYSGYYDPEQVRQREEILAEAAADAEWKCEGFAEMVLNKGYGAVGPPDRMGRPRSWQGIGRDLFGVEMFNRYLNQAMASRRAARQASPSERP